MAGGKKRLPGKGGPVHKSGAKVRVQFGPTPSAPGSRLKPTKGVKAK